MGLPRQENWSRLPFPSLAGSGSINTYALFVLWGHWETVLEQETIAFRILFPISHSIKVEPVHHSFFFSGLAGNNRPEE